MVRKRISLILKFSQRGNESSRVFIVIVFIVSITTILLCTVPLAAVANVGPAERTWLTASPYAARSPLCFGSLVESVEPFAKPSSRSPWCRCHSRLSSRSTRIVVGYNVFPTFERYSFRCNICGCRVKTIYIFICSRRFPQIVPFVPAVPAKKKKPFRGRRVSE